VNAGPLRAESVRGALIALTELGLPVIRSNDPEGSALWLKLLAGRRFRKRRDAVFLARNPTPPPEAMLAAVPGISVVSARALLSEFGTIADIAEAGRERWLSVPGIGPVRASALDRAFRQGQRLPSRPRSGRPAPST
jgi:ERCC4-type nuclease